MAFNDIENKSIVVGQSHEAAIHEPAVATLVVGFGVVLIRARCIFKR
jgi:hypothetical protein